MITRIWEVHKRFIIGIVVGVLFLLVFYYIFVAPLDARAKKSVQSSADVEKRLKGLFSSGKKEHPTRTTINQYNKVLSALNTRRDEIRTMVGFPVQAPYVLPAGELMPQAYYVDVFSKTKREIQAAANSRAVAVQSQVLAGMGRVDDVPSALVALAVMRHALLSAVASGVSSLDSVAFQSGERSAPFQGFRLEEKLITVTVKGSPKAVQDWLVSLGRRDAFLMIASASLKGPENIEAGEEVTAKVQIGPLTVKEAALPKEGEEEEG